ncbi:synaptic vesicle glycoprotein 2C-like [Leptidea sinapis]|uniref:synaptic vesicle glycoprotein 2C-like n=1 Tax=Leptidea sinapis TaxID=189913 RepID=UPI0021C47B09|nr:synaptic vesicle glycoprotein 2C-like [Leptidea sinapis]
MDFEDVMEKIGFGKYNICLLLTCCLLIMGMYIDIFGVSVVLPYMTCDLSLTSSQQGLLSAIPLVGVMVSSYGWGLSADIIGRKRTLVIATPISVVFSIAASLAPSFISFAVLKILSAGFSSSANAAGFVLVGESVPARYRSKCTFLTASSTLLVNFIISGLALPIFQMTLNVELLPAINLRYRPWRLLLQIITLPAIIGCLGMFAIKESPKLLLSKGKEPSAIEVLQSMYASNHGSKCLSVTSISLSESLTAATSSRDCSYIQTIWNQTAPLFKPPLLKNSVILYYILLCSFMTSTGFTMWMPTVINAYFSGDNNDGKTFCAVASTAVVSANQTVECDNIVQPMTLYITMVNSGLTTILNIILTFLVGPLGKKTTTVLVLIVSIAAGILLLLVRQQLISIGLFFIFLFVVLVLGNINIYLVELNPTHLRGMATSLSVVVARGFGFISVQIIGSLLQSHCTSMITGYIILITSGLIVAFFLPQDKNKSQFGVS